MYKAQNSDEHISINLECFFSNTLISWLSFLFHKLFLILFVDGILDKNTLSLDSVVSYTAN